MNNSRSIRTCVIGFGNVGRGLYLKSASQNSHFSCIQANRKYSLVAVVDPNINERGIDMPDVLFTRSIKEVQDVNADLVVIASPSSTHLETCREIKKYLKPSAILIEKPAGLTLAECREIMRCLQEIPIVVVNYQRNYDQKIVRQISDTIRFGYTKGTVYYSNGAINNASHGLALLISTLGSPTNVFRSSNSMREDLSDMNLDFVVDFGQTRVFFIATEEANYSMFRIELFGPKGSWLYDASLGRSERRDRVDDPIYLDRFNLTENSLITSISDADSFSNVYKHLEERILEDSDIEHPIGASLDLAYDVHRVLKKVRR